MKCVMGDAQLIEEVLSKRVVVDKWINRWLALQVYIDLHNKLYMVD